MGLRSTHTRLSEVGLDYRWRRGDINNDNDISLIARVIHRKMGIKGLPFGAKEIHHEVELGIVIGKQLSKVKPADFTDAIQGFVIALDMTNRELQQGLKSRQLPWTLAKCFDTSCPLGPLLPTSKFPASLLSPQDNVFHEEPNATELWLRVNGEERQRGRVNQMLHSPAKLISFISQHMSLEPGDLILTGTPAGVGPVRSGDVISCGIEGLCEVQFSVE